MSWGKVATFTSNPLIAILPAPEGTPCRLDETRSVQDVPPARHPVIDSSFGLFQWKEANPYVDSSLTT